MSRPRPGAGSCHRWQGPCTADPSFFGRPRDRHAPASPDPCRHPVALAFGRARGHRTATSGAAVGDLASGAPRRTGAAGGACGPGCALASCRRRARGPLRARGPRFARGPRRAARGGRRRTEAAPARVTCRCASIDSRPAGNNAVANSTTTHHGTGFVGDCTCVPPRKATSSSTTHSPSRAGHVHGANGPSGKSRLEATDFIVNAP